MQYGHRTIHHSKSDFACAAPPDSPDIALSDFRLFGYMKNSLAGRTFDEPEQLLEAITEFLDEIQPSELEALFSHWVERIA
jgi:hypothetical protein